MFQSLVASSAGRLSESQIAVITLETFFRIVYVLMLSQSFRRLKTIVANVAGEQTHIGMRLFMVLQPVWSKITITVFAFNSFGAM